MTGNLSWVFVGVIAFGISATSTVFGPARDAIIPRLAEGRSITRVNAFFQTSVQLAFVTGALCVGILLGLGVYIAVTLYAVWMQSVWQFYLLAVVIGLVQGGVQALSRSLYVRLIPPGQTTEFFGLYNMVGKFAAVLGPALVGWITLITNSNRIGILSIVVLFLGGGYLLLRVKVDDG